MKRLLMFLLCVGILCCILAACFGVGEAGHILYNLGAVILLAVGATAMCAAIPTSYPPKGPNR